jgi:Cu2+-exporting ATPase
MTHDNHHPPQPDHGSHDKHEGHSPEMFRDRLWLSLVLTVPILYLSLQFQDWFGYQAWEFPGDGLVNPVLATVLYLYAGNVFLKGSVRELRGRQPGMMTLVAVAISVAYAYSIAVSLGLDGKPFYWELATLLDVMLLGHWMEMRSVRAASSALDDLAAMVPDVAHLLSPDGSIADVRLGELGVGDRVLIRPGEQVPIDGTIADGASSINESFLTGESRPVAKEIDDEVLAGSVNGEGALTVVITRMGDETALSQIMRLVSDAQESRSRYQALADRAAMWLTVVAIGVSLPTFLAWYLFGSDGLTFAIARTVTVLVIACPHALGLAIPLVTTNATSIAARNGILVRNREAFERGRGVSIVAFDKTGTLTEGRFVVTAVTTNGSSGEGQVLALAASLERSSEHPLASAIVDAAVLTDIDIPTGQQVTAVPGFGIEGTVDGRQVRIGRPGWAAQLGVETPGSIKDALAAADERGESAVLLIDGSEAIAVISLADKVRDNVGAALNRLRALDVEPVMITGDAEAVARAVAGDLGITRYFARVLPEQKAKLVADLKREGMTAFVGDGINDAPALLGADLGIAIGAGTNVAIESADLVLIDDDPADAAAALELARATSRKMRQNLAWATGYNVVAIPLAAGVAYSAGIVLDPAVGGLLMSASTVIVALNATLLRRFDIT